MWLQCGLRGCSTTAEKGGQKWRSKKRKWLSQNKNVEDWWKISEARERTRA